MADARLGRSCRLFLVAAALCAPMGGCWPGYYPGGNYASRGLFTYESTPDFPQTVSLVDTRTGETVWTQDVPVGQQLVIRFYPEQNSGNTSTPDVMRWELMRAEQRTGDLTNRLDVPPANGRRVDVALRKAPEYHAPDFDAMRAQQGGGVPTSYPAASGRSNPYDQGPTANQGQPAPASEPAPAEQPAEQPATPPGR